MSNTTILAELVDAARDPNTGDNLTKTGDALRNIFGGTVQDLGSSIKTVVDSMRELKATADPETKLELEREVRILEMVGKLTPEAQVIFIQNGGLDDLLKGVHDERARESEHRWAAKADAARERKEWLSTLAKTAIGGFGTLRVCAQMNETTTEQAALNSAVNDALRKDGDVLGELIHQVGTPMAETLLTGSIAAGKIKPEELNAAKIRVDETRDAVVNGTQNWRDRAKADNAIAATMQRSGR